MRMGFMALVLMLAGQISSDAQGPKPGDLMMERYLAHQTAQISQRVLTGAKTAAEWQERRKRLQQEHLDMLGLWPLPKKTPLHPVITGTLERPGIVIEKLHFQSVPNFYVTAHLYRPKKVEGKLPAIVFFMGHYNRGRNGHKSFMQDHGMWFASNGYVCIILDTIERGEIPGMPHQGLYRNDRWWWLAAGFTPAGVECWNGIRAIDYLVSRPEVDAERIAATGLSGGGTVTFWVTAADDRIKVAVPVSGMTDLENNVTNKMICLHCDCQIPYNIYGWEFTTVAALAAPRPLLFVNSHDDVGFPMAANRRIMARLRPLYEMLGKPDLLDDFVSHGPPGAHAYLPDSRVAIFKWLNKHLKHDTGPVKDADFERIPEEDLRVFPQDNDFPRDAINTRIDEVLYQPAQVDLPTPANFEAWKQRLVKSLRERSFRSFPERIPISDRYPGNPVTFKFKDLQREDGKQTRITEIGIEVNLHLQGLNSQGEPRDKGVTLVVLNEDEDLHQPPAWTKHLKTEGEAVVYLSPRGCGPTAFTQTPPHYVPRRWHCWAERWMMAAFGTSLPRPAGWNASKA